MTDPQSGTCSPKAQYPKAQCPKAQCPKAAYVHVPFCARRCGYCNFTLVAGRDDLVEPYLLAVQSELRQLGTPREVDTLFIGGGTPTQLTASQLSRLMTLAVEWFPPTDGAEITVEANPSDLDSARIGVLAEHGTTRISLGAQSFDAVKLQRLERDHGAADIRRAVALARRHLPQLALDLIFGVPGETIEGWQQDLATTMQLQPDHVSTYGLTYERGASFWARRRKGQLVPVAEDVELAMYETAIDTLTQAGLEHYEISNFARAGARSRHNEVYWTGGGYYAAGPGAARFVDGTRETNHRSTTTYIKRVLAGQSPVAERETLSPEEAARERLIFGLRRLEGIDLAEFQDETGFSVDRLAGPAIDRHVADGRLTRDGHRLRLTRKGLVVSDAIWPDLL